MDAEINNVIYMELYSGPKMAHGKYEKTDVARSIDRDSTVYVSPSCLFVTDTNIYVKDILSTDPPLVTDILIFSDPPHNPPKLSFRANGHTKSKGAVLPNSMKKGKNLEMLITATSQAHI
jgi:hypothetical protein